MARVTITRNIEAAADVVFQAVADPKQFAQAISGVTRLDFLSPSASGVGTRFRQSRTLNGKEMTMDFEVTEYLPNQRVRIVNETHGTVWDSVFTVSPAASRTTLTMVMNTRSRPLIARLLMPVICLLIRKSVAKDIDAVKTYCERQTVPAA